MRGMTEEKGERGEERSERREETREKKDVAAQDTSAKHVREEMEMTDTRRHK